ncbi:MAG TPA: SURF1 family protein [Ilumatobacteraceae bacterium]|nr:SURF1 family protein [Ilumatobacteraceae bacterium]
MSGSSRTFLLGPKWIAFHLLVFGSIALMIWLAFWQLQRLDERQAFNATVTERIDEPPVPFNELLAVARTDPGSVEWRQVTVTGEYLPDQVIWFNRSQDGLAGDNVLAALVDGGTTIVINRGFVPLGDEVASPPSGEIDVLGRIRLAPARQRGELTDATDGVLTEVRRIDLERLGDQLPGELAPVYLDLIGTIPNIDATDPVPVPPPTLSDGPHLSYAVQWLIFAVAVLIGWVFAVRRSIATHRRRDLDVTDAEAVQTSSDSPTSVDASSTTTTP